MGLPDLPSNFRDEASQDHLNDVSFDDDPWEPDVRAGAVEVERKKCPVCYDLLPFSTEQERSDYDEHVRHHEALARVTVQGAPMVGGSGKQDASHQLATVKREAG